MISQMSTVRTLCPNPIPFYLLLHSCFFTFDTPIMTSLVVIGFHRSHTILCISSNLIITIIFKISSIVTISHFEAEETGSQNKLMSYSMSHSGIWTLTFGLQISCYFLFFFLRFFLFLLVFLFVFFLLLL